MSTFIRYRDIAPGAAEAATVTATATHALSNLALIPFGLPAPKPIITTEHNNWGLTGEFECYTPDSIAYWSNVLSQADCTFATAPTTTVSLSQQFSSLGVNLTFDPRAQTHCTRVNLKWYRGAALLSDMDFFPTGTEFYCQNKVESFDRVVITPQETNLPGRFAKLEMVMFGVNRTFYMDEMRSATVTLQMGGISLELPISTLRWTLDSHTDVEFMFQEKQPMELWNNDILVGVFYVDSHSQVSARVYNIVCQDALGVLEESRFAGGVYTNKSAQQLVRDIVGSDFELIFEAPNRNLTGKLDAQSKRDALQQVLFAWGVHASTDGTQAIRIFSPGTEVTEIPPSRTYLGASVDTAPITTQVSVTARTYTAAGDVASEQVFTVHNPAITGNAKANTQEVTSATLIAPAIGLETAQRLLAYEERRQTARAKIVWRGERLGDCVSLPNAWGGVTVATVEQLDLIVSNTMAANATAKGVAS